MMQNGAAGNEGACTEHAKPLVTESQLAATTATCGNGLPLSLESQLVRRVNETKGYYHVSCLHHNDGGRGRRRDLIGRFNSVCREKIPPKERREKNHPTTQSKR
jgi:hypothetical protein